MLDKETGAGAQHQMIISKWKIIIEAETCGCQKGANSIQTAVELYEKKMPNGIFFSIA
jgi:hypothetical protein